MPFNDMPIKYPFYACITPLLLDALFLKIYGIFSLRYLLFFDKYFTNHLTRYTPMGIIKIYPWGYIDDEVEREFIREKIT